MGTIDTHAALEYSLFKFPYERLNKKFRDTQKAIDKQNYRVAETMKQLSKELPSDKEVPVEKVAAPLAALHARLAEMEELMGTSLDEEIAEVDQLLMRAEYLKREEDGKHDKMEHYHWEKQRVDRMVIMYLLRSGELEKARLRAETNNLMHLCDVEAFEEFQKVEQSLADGDLNVALQWIHDNRSKLRRINSNLEVQIRVAEIIDLVREGKKREAIQYVRTHLSKAIQDKDPLALKVMGVIACGFQVAEQAYSAVLKSTEPEQLAAQFRSDINLIYNLGDYDPLSVCLQAGISAHKTPSCCPGANDRCRTCKPKIYALGKGLPYAHSKNSRLICAYTGDAMNESNVPLMLASGWVYGEKAVVKLREGDMVRCPRTNRATPLKDVRRLYIV